MHIFRVWRVQTVCAAPLQYTLQPRLDGFAQAGLQPAHDTNATNDTNDTNDTTATA